MGQLVLYAALPSSVPTIRCSPPSWAAHIALHEVGADHRVEWLRFDRGDHKSERMLAISPAGTVPVLVDGGAVFTDTVAILDRIAEHGRGMPTGDDARRAAAVAIKTAGMAALRRIMSGASRAEAFAELEVAVTRWHGGELDVPGLLAFVYLVTADSLGFSTERWTLLGEWLAATRQRPAVTRAWPETLT